MNELLIAKKSVALLLSLLLAFSVTAFFASAENGEIAESDTYYKRYKAQKYICKIESIFI